MVIHWIVNKHKNYPFLVHSRGSSSSVEMDSRFLRKRTRTAINVSADEMLL